MLKQLTLSALLLSGSAAVSAEPLDRAATLFGVRESVQSIDLSPDGSTVVYVAPGPGSTSVVNVAHVEGMEKPVTRSSGKPDRLNWCNFASNERLVCRLSTVANYEGTLIGASQLLSLNADGTDVKQLGQRNSFYDLRLRQFDGDILDWLPGDGNSVLMSREYVPEGRAATRMLRTKDGLGVDKVDIRTLKTSVVEPADRQASAFLSDGRGNVRIREVLSTRMSGEQMGSRTTYYYRKKGSSFWEKLGSYDSSTRAGMIPLAVDADLGVAYVLQKLNGRFALYRMKLDGSLAAETRLCER